MNKPLVTCTALCAAAAAFALLHGSVGDRAAPAGMTPAHAPRAATHIVAVDEHGVVLASDDDGKTWQRAPREQVPATLPAVAFGDARSGLGGLFTH
ncbi:hypothetical protein WT67_32615 [Burkholderia stagnalis]|uniref:Glycosyl hydrolase n=1 Tax=Burkholderia stagnalis TaxID=1503054 RepID=A0A6L3MXG6_9BURK|nr:hypothetical protein [Burkholderia stagnalis]KAB0637041.1 hypothetical protein F7R25_17280 [Burkholderia stagnalis]KVN25728.1 hypothetical protein WT11_01690 [Burkholderia stagnalis]KVO73811.1 hypothetical protein WT19_13500 [Burkholderia stagnalis]KVW65321.1 hypothetical protein WT28_07895 [Burkholderia stagnalis]KVX79101.1 hypothetical protein WT34_08720 [Burkholderia stagnalis]